MQLLVTLFSSLILMSTNVQSSKHDELYEAIDQMEDVTTMSFSKSILDGIDIDFDVEEKLSSVKGDFNQVTFSIISKDNPSNALKIHELLKKSYFLIEHENDEDSDFYMLKDQKGDHVSEIIFFVKDLEGTSFLLCLEGDMILTKNEDEE